MKIFGIFEVSPEEVLSIFKRIPFLKKKITKEAAQVLFIDDEKFPIVENLRSAGWSVKRLSDITDLDHIEIKRAHIIFVDYKGVGKKMSPTEEGIGLIKALINKYKKSKRIILYSGHGGFTLGEHLKAAHNQMTKNSDLYEFITMIESELLKL